MKPSPQPSPYRERGLSPLLKEARRSLRRNQTPAENALWKILRSRQLNKYKFRRQHPIGAYIADFCCLETKLVIEADGDYHADQVNQDLDRTANLESLGFRVIRFWNHEILKEAEAVCQRILASLEEVPVPAQQKASTYRWRR